VRCLGTTCLGSIKFQYSRREKFQFYCQGRIKNEWVVGSLSKTVQRSKHDIDGPPLSCAEVDMETHIITSPLPHDMAFRHKGCIYLITKSFMYHLEFYSKGAQGLLNCQVTLWTKSALDLFTAYTNPQKCFTTYRIFSNTSCTLCKMNVTKNVSAKSVISFTVILIST
jgi:hypothetical protein